MSCIICKEEGRTIYKVKGLSTLFTILSKLLRRVVKYKVSGLALKTDTGIIEGELVNEYLPHPVVVVDASVYLCKKHSKNVERVKLLLPEEDYYLIYKDGSRKVVKGRKDEEEYRDRCQASS